MSELTYDRRTRLTAASASKAVMSGRACRTVRTASSVWLRVILAGRSSIGESLADDVLKVGVHAGYESAIRGKRKAPPERGSRLWPVAKVRFGVPNADWQTPEQRYECSCCGVTGRC